MAICLAASALVQATEDPVLCENTSKQCSYYGNWKCESLSQIEWRTEWCPGNCGLMCNEDGSFASGCAAYWPCHANAICTDGEGGDYTCERYLEAYDFGTQYSRAEPYCGYHYPGNGKL